jgi:hypothetical protein
MNGVSAEKEGVGGPELSPALRKLAEEWLTLDRNPSTVQEIERLRDDGDEKTLQSLLGSRMVFGTAGLRAKMGAGYSRMNDLTVIQTAQGLASCLLEQFGSGECGKRGVAVGYDARHNSRSHMQW